MEMETYTTLCSDLSPTLPTFLAGMRKALRHEQFSICTLPPPDISTQKLSGELYRVDRRCCVQMWWKFARSAHLSLLLGLIVSAATSRWQTHEDLERVVDHPLQAGESTDHDDTARNQR